MKILEEKLEMMVKMHNLGSSDFSQIETVLLEAMEPQFVKGETAAILPRLTVDPGALEQIIKIHGNIIALNCSNEFLLKIAERVKAFFRRGGVLTDLQADDKKFLLELTQAHNRYLLRLFMEKELDPDDLREAVLQKSIVRKTSLREVLLPLSSAEELLQAAETELLHERYLQSVRKESFDQRILSLHRHLYDKGTYQSFHQDGGTHEHPLDLLTFSLKTLLLNKSRKNTNDVREILLQFFRDPFRYFSKLALFVVGSRLDAYRELFWARLEEEDKLLDETYCQDEIKFILQNLKGLNDSERQKLKNRIEQGPVYFPYTDKEKYSLFWKQERYHALSHDLHFKELYSRLREKTGIELELKSVTDTAQEFRNDAESPLKVWEILDLTNLELAVWASYVSGLPESVQKGFLKNLRTAARQTPGKFLSEGLSPFQTVSFTFVASLLHGFREAWESFVYVDWHELTSFVKSLVSMTPFWTLRLRPSETTESRSSLMEAMAQLLGASCERSNWPVEEDVIVAVQEILFQILREFKRESDQGQKPLKEYWEDQGGPAVFYAFTLVSVAELERRSRKLSKQELRWTA